jgi:hypothetical protein
MFPGKTFGNMFGRNIRNFRDILARNIRKHVPGRNIRKHIRENIRNMFEKNILDISKKTFGTCSGKHPEHCSGKKFGNMFDNISKKIPGNM